MAKKTSKKIVKTLPSALTIATPVESRPAKSPEPVAKNPVPPVVFSSPPLTAAMPEKMKAMKAPAPGPVQTVFELHDPQARLVSLCGEFNHWTPGANPMARQADGVWRTSLPLAPGRYQYKFVVDGNWFPDIKAIENVLNEHGTLNSVRIVSANTAES